MKALTHFLLLLLVLGMACSCSRELYQATQTDPVHAAIEHQLDQAIAARNIKFNGPVTLQVGTTSSTATTTDASKAKSPVAAAPNAVATATTTTAGTPWYVYAGGVLLIAAVGAYFGHKV